MPIHHTTLQIQRSYEGHLGQWLDDQRKAIRGKKGTVIPERQHLLQQLVDEGMLLYTPYF